MCKSTLVWPLLGRLALKSRFSKEPMFGAPTEEGESLKKRILSSSSVSTMASEGEERPMGDMAVMPDRCGIRGAGFRIVPFFAAGLLEVLQL